MPSRHTALEALDHYLDRMQAAVAANQHHDQRRAILQELLRAGFDLSVDELELERNIKVARTRGRVDLLYQSMAWEVKRDLDRERQDMERELDLYLSDLGDNSFGVGTDGLRFEVYQLDTTGTLRQVDKFSLVDPRFDLGQALDWLDSYLFAIDNVRPTTESVLARFGLNSAVFKTTELQLLQLWEQVVGDSTVGIKRSEWEKLLNVVYGTHVASDELWVRHTYLVLVARLLAYLAVVQHLPQTGSELGILTGDLFAQLGFPNLVERDFFAWAATPILLDPASRIIRALSHHLRLFSFDRIDEDLLKELYEHLVDPTERAWLGEFYTPDWLADYVLARSGFGPETRMLDPACGSGTFLFAAIRRLRESGLTGEALVIAARDHVIGFDIHPLAVTVSKVNYLLALKDDVRELTGELTIPVFMADTLAAPIEGFGRMVEIQVPRVPGRLPDRFHLPTETEETQSCTLTQLVELIDELSDPALPEDQASAGLDARLETWGVAGARDFWQSNLRLLRALIRNNLDTVWRSILTNAARPHEIASDPVDLIVGNPPWLTVLDMASSEYKERVKLLAHEFRLLGTGGARMGVVSHLDTSTIFAVYCAEYFLRHDGGRVAFVLPRSVMAGARQHRNFREGRAALSYAPVEEIDLDLVEPLFRIPACVMVFETVSDELKPPAPWTWPHRALVGTLPRKNASRSEATVLREVAPSPPRAPTRSSPYLARATQGVDIRPRAFWLVEPDPEARLMDRERPRLRSDHDAVSRATEVWRGISISGRVETTYLYATSLDVDPYRLGRLRLLALPVEGDGTDGLTVLSQQQVLSRGDGGMARWLAQVEREFQAGLARANRSARPTAIDYLNMQDKLGRHKPNSFRVLWAKGGAHIRAAVVPDQIEMVAGLAVQGFVVDLNHYCIVCESESEAHFLAAILNSAHVSEIVNSEQTRGLYGARDIHRRPFEFVPIPLFDATDATHRVLAEQSRVAHTRALNISVASSRNRDRYMTALGDIAPAVDALALEVLSRGTG